MNLNLKNTFNYGEVKLEPSENLLHPEAKITIQSKDKTESSPIDRSIADCFLEGHVMGHEKMNSRARVSICDGLKGMIFHRDEHHFIEPVHDDLKLGLK